MKPMDLRRPVLLVATLATLLFPAGRAAAQDSTVRRVPVDSLRRKTPSGQYTDPASFFRFHGYVTLGYSEPGADLGREAFASPQILLPGLSPRTGRNEGGFRNDAALFVGGEPFEGIGAVVEIHFVGNALDPVITEAKITYDAITAEHGKNGALRIVGGRFWWPFGIHNEEWFSAINRFSLVSPAAAEVVPAHYNEVGVMVEGELSLSPTWGANFVASVGNGVPSFEVMDNVGRTGFDENQSRTSTGRVSLASFGKVRVDLGMSGAYGTLRDGTVANPNPAVAEDFGGKFWALGPDLTLSWERVGFRGYFYASRELLDGAPRAHLDRYGFTAEPSVTLWRQPDGPRAVSLVGRVSSATEETVLGTRLRRSQYGVAIDARVRRALYLRAGYTAQSEGKQALRLDNNVASLSVTATF